MSVALFTGVTGLLAHQARLDVVANNIANVNTTGYRSSRMVFQDLFSMTLQGGAGPQGSFGGVNPEQIGLGVSIGSIDVIHTEGSLLTTGLDSDLAIEGNGFFILEDGNGTTYTRDGSFLLNASGTLVDPATGRRVQGWTADETGTLDTEAAIGDVQINLGGTAAASATTEAILVGNLDSDAEAGDVVTRTIEVYDSLGTAREMTIAFTKEATPENSWTYSVTYDGTEVGSGTLSFNADGTMPDGTTGQITAAGTLFNSNGSQPEDLDITIDFSSVTQLSVTDDTGSDVTLSSQDGYPMGVLQSFSVASNGQITGVFSNGLRRTIGQVALATFSNVGGLERSGQNGFVETTASGVAQVGLPLTGGRGSIAGGVLESSNVDLATEFANLIVTQRGFQANSRTITTADTLLQETVNLSR